jgi:hypothetical protein
MSEQLVIVCRWPFLFFNNLLIIKHSVKFFLSDLFGPLVQKDGFSVRCLGVKSNLVQGFSHHNYLGFCFMVGVKLHILMHIIDQNQSREVW